MYRALTNLTRPATRILIWSFIFLLFSLVIHTGLIRGSHANQESAFLVEAAGIYETPQSNYSFYRGSGIIPFYIYGSIDTTIGKSGASIFDFLLFACILILSAYYTILLTNDKESSLIAVIILSVYPTMFFITSFSSNIILALIFSIIAAIFQLKAIRSRKFNLPDSILFSLSGVLASNCDFYLLVLFALAIIILTVANLKNGLVAIAVSLVLIIGLFFIDTRFGESVLQFYQRNFATGNIIHNFVNVLKYNMLPFMLFGLVMNMRHRYGMSNKVYLSLIIFVSAPIALSLFATDALQIIRLTSYSAFAAVPFMASFMKDTARNYDANFFGVQFILLVMAMVSGGMFFI